jgi:hypothetical protein
METIAECVESSIGFFEKYAAQWVTGFNKKMLCSHRGFRKISNHDANAVRAEYRAFCSTADVFAVFLCPP